MVALNQLFGDALNQIVKKKSQRQTHPFPPVNFRLPSRLPRLRVKARMSPLFNPHTKHRGCDYFHLKTNNTLIIFTKKINLIYFPNASNRAVP